MHFAGHPCVLKEIYDIVKRYDLIIIEDACHTLGAEYRNSKVGSCKYSDMTVFSFHPTKSITTGEGEAVLTNNKKIYEKLLMFRNRGITEEDRRFKIKNSRLIGPWYYEILVLGFNYRITDFQCVLGISQLKKINKFIKRRKEIAEIYNKSLSEIDEIILPKERPYVKSSWHLYYIRSKDSRKRKSLLKKLQNAGRGAQVHYIPVYQQPYFKKRFRNKINDYPKAEIYYRRTIPLCPKIRQSALKYIIKILKEKHLYENFVN